MAPIMTRLEEIPAKRDEPLADDPRPLKLFGLKGTTELACSIAEKLGERLADHEEPTSM